MSTAAAFQVDATTVDMEMEGLGHIAELASAAGSTPAPSIHVQRARALWAVSCLTLAADMSAGLFQPARGPVFGRHSTAYYSVLAAILAIVAVEMTVAYRLPRRSCAQDEEDDRGRVLAFANGLLRFGVVLLLVMVAVGGFALTVKL